MLSGGTSYHDSGEGRCSALCHNRRHGHSGCAHAESSYSARSHKKKRLSYRGAKRQHIRRPSPTEAAHVAEDLSGKIAMIIDGGPVGIGIESTIIDLTEDTPMVLRPGYITPQMLSKVLGKEVIIDPGIIAADDTRKPKAPGMKYKHYAPKADMAIVDGTRKHVIAKINELVASHRDDGKKIAVIATEETKQFYDADVVLSMGSRADEDSIAHELYRILRDCDELDVDVIFSESFSTPRIGQAIMNRMLKAAGHQVIDTHVKYDKIIFVAQTAHAGSRWQRAS